MLATFPSLATITNLQDERIASTSHTPIHLSLNHGTYTVITGQNGSGKTTLLRCLAHLTKPDSGHIETTPYFSYLGAKSGLKPLATIKSFIEWTLNTPIHSFNLKDIPFFENLKGVDYNKTLHQLSSGQQIALRLSLLFAQKVNLWILDEPFRFLDQSSCTFLKQHIQRHCQNGGSVIATVHPINLSQLELLPNADLMTHISLDASVKRFENEEV